MSGGAAIDERLPPTAIFFRCGRFSLGTNATTLAAQFDLFEAQAWTPRYNIAPTQEALVVVQDPATARRQARRHRWGLIPSWAKDPSIQEMDRLQPLLRPYPDEGMVAYPVGRVVNNPANDDPRCIETQQ